MVTKISLFVFARFNVESAWRVDISPGVENTRRKIGYDLLYKSPSSNAYILSIDRKIRTIALLETKRRRKA